MSEIILPGLKPIPEKPLFTFETGDRVRVITPAINKEGIQTIYNNSDLFDFVKGMEKYIDTIGVIRNAWSTRTHTRLGVEYGTYTLEKNDFAYRSFFLVPAHVDDQEAIELLKERFQQQFKN